MLRLLSLVLLSMMVIACASAPLIAPYSPTATNLTLGATPPTLEHLLGTDAFGRDVLSRLLFSARASTAAAVVSTLVAVVPALIVAAISVLASARISAGISTVNSVFLAIPGIIMAFVVITVLRPGLWSAAIAVGFSLFPVFLQYALGVMWLVRMQIFVERSVSSGASVLHLLFWHLLPSAYRQLLVLSILIFAYAVLSLAGLSFLGVVGSPSTPTLGVLFEEGRRVFLDAPWVAISAGGWLSILVTTLLLLAASGESKMPPT